MTDRKSPEDYNDGYEAGFARAMTITGRAKPPQQFYACELCACNAADEDGCLHPAEEIFEMRMGLWLCREHAIEAGNGDLSRPLSRRIAKALPHPDDAAIDQFALAMKMKMAVKRAEGFDGWHDKQQLSAEDLSRMLHEHVSKGDPIDVAIFAMMLQMRIERIVADWRPIAEADKGIAYYHQVAELKIGASHPTWVRDADGRVYEAIWSDDGKRSYWWDLEGESPVNPVEFMPHPLARAATATTGAEHAD